LFGNKTLKAIVALPYPKAARPALQKLKNTQNAKTLPPDFLSNYKQASHNHLT
jgi:hypothetical protein